MEARPTRAAAVRPSPLSSLHRAKLRRPAMGEHHVRRPRLLDLCDEAASAPLTLVVAPAGTGKTSLVAGWTAESATPTAWLSLDDLDRDGVSFWTHVIATLDDLAPKCGDRALAILRRPGSRSDAILQLLVDLEAESRPPALLVIDDFHLVDDDDFIVESMSLFVQNQPAWLRLVLLSRREPRFPIDRMRARGHLGEVRFAELRFSPDEAVELMTRLAPTMSEERITAAVERADGWATSLQLAALAARSRRARPDVRAPEQEDDLLLQHYVLHEVLENESPELIDTLCAAAVVPRINSVLARTLTGRPDAGELLQTAEARGLFLTRGDTGGWFDLHALIREVLLADLVTRSPSRLDELHVRAAQWFETTGEVLTAVEQWWLANRPREVLRLLSANHAPLYDSGQEAIVKRLIAAIPKSVAVGELEAMIDYAWCHLLVDRRRFVELVEALTWWADRSNPSRTLRARVDMLRASAAVASGRWVESGELSRQVMRELGPSCWQDPLGRFAANGVAREAALSERWDDSADEVRQAELALSRDPERRLSFEGIRALGEALAGRPLDALRVAAGVRHAAAVANMTILRTELAMAEALAYRELGDRPRALAGLEALVEAPAETMLFCRILAMCELAGAHLDGGDLDAAEQVFRRAKDIVETESLGSGIRDWLNRLAVVIAVAGNDPAAAGRWASEIDDHFWAGVSAARAALATGDRAAAIVSLDMAEPRCVRHEVVLTLLKSRAVSDRDEAMKYASTAVETASGVGLLQTVASEGSESSELVERAAWRAPEEWLDRLRRCTAEAWALGGTAGATVAEPLTERERDVLRFLPSRMTVREIADELFISMNTAKFHLRVIYRKLGVTTRAEAAEVARGMTRIRR